ncbi:MAG: hypothetical protein AB7O52_10670 [Planctomycetota bacterium]
MPDWLRSPELILEVVPPPSALSEAGIDSRLELVARIGAHVPIRAVNIPEIREETSKSAGGERRTAFEERVEPRVLAARIQEQLGVPAIINRVVVHLDSRRQADWFRETYEVFGVRNFVLVGGERSHVQYPGPSVAEANLLIRQALPHADLRVGNISIPGRRSRMDESERMAQKAAHGVDFFTTQIVYHCEEFTGLLDGIAERQPGVATVPIFLSVCPLKTPHSVAFLRWLGVHIEEPLEATLLADGAKQLLACSLEHLVGTWRSIRSHCVARGLKQPIGVNIAPVGPIPVSATVKLARELARIGF